MKTLKRTLALVLVLALSASLLAVGGFAAATVTYPDNFKDYTDADAAKASEHVEAIDVVMGLGIINGMSDTEIGVDGNLTRAQAAKIVTYVALGKDVAEALAAGETGFTDVGADMWANKYIAYCAFKGWLNGYGDGTFGPNDNLTGYAFAKMLLNALGYGLKTNSDGEIVNEYTGAYWATAVSQKANALELFKGIKDVNFSGDITRAQAMQITFNALKAPVNPANTYGGKYAGYVPVTGGTGKTDAYGRDIAYYYVGSDDTKAVSASYAKEADYVYAASAPTTYADVLKAYNKDNGTEYTSTNTGAIPAGTVVEFKIDKTAKTFTMFTTYTYTLETVSKVYTTAKDTAPHKGAFEFDLKSGTKNGTSEWYTDDLSVKVAKGDVLVIPVCNTYLIMADAAVITPVTAKATSFKADTSDATKSYIVVNGNKVYADTGYVTAVNKLADAEASANVIKADFNTAYDYYLNPKTGSLLGAVKNSGESDVEYTVEYGYVIGSQAQGYTSSTSDLLGETAASKKAAAVIKMLNTDGTVDVKNIAIADKSTNSTPDYKYVGTDAINFFNKADTTKKVVDVAATYNTNKDTIVKYYTNDDGDIVVLDVIAPVTVETTKAKPEVKVGSNTYYATSDTKLTVIAKTAANADTYVASTDTGFSKFIDANSTSGTPYANALVLYVQKDGADTNKIDTIYVFAAPAAAAKADLAALAYCTEVGEDTADGTEYKFLIAGEKVTYYKNSDTQGTAPIKGGCVFVKLASDGKTVDSFTAVTDNKVSNAKVVALDNGYILTNAQTNGTVYYGTTTVKTYDVTGKDVELGEDVTVDIYQNTTDTVIFITKAAE